MSRWIRTCVAGIAALATGALPGCRDDGTTDTTDAQQVIAEILVLAETDPDGALAAINDLPTDLEQLLAVEQLLINGPNRALTQPSCDALLRKGPRDRCLSLISRPHLLRTGGSTSKAMDQLAPETLSAQFDCLGGDSGGSQTPLQVALTRVRRAPPGDPSVEATCDCLSDADQRGECRFEGAQRLIQESGAPALGQALVLCDVGGGLARDCMSHILETGLKTVSPTCSGQEPDWTLLFLAGYGLQETSPELGELGEQRRWSRAASTVFRDGFCLAPEVGAAVPAAARPHLTAAAAWWSVAHAPDPLSLEDLRGRTRRALLGELALVGPDAELPGIPQGGGPASVGRPPTLPDGISNVVYLATSYRARADDEEADAAICILEAASRQGRGMDTLLSAAAEQDDPALRHTAARLGR